VRPDFECKVQSQGFLRFIDIGRVVEHLESGDLCLLPSDSSYTLTGLPTEPGVSRDLDVVLQRNQLEMSLAFGSLRMARRWVEMSDMAARFVGALTPGGLTFVGPPMSVGGRGLATKRLHAPAGTIGVRLTESRVETQLAYEIEQPLTSTPVRLPDGSEARTAEEALDVVADRILALESGRRLSMIVGKVLYPGRLSTVVTQEIHPGRLARIRVLREGAISLATIRRVASDCRYEGVDVGRAH
jgi:tRNA A37 threonylcarbamoyladenosine synthetase subunit TsaC/SUA5/YrdC